jgi:hypothetical protein
MVKHYYKVVDEYGEVIAVGYGYNENEITEEEYNRLREEILSRKTDEEPSNAMGLGIE